MKEDHSAVCRRGTAWHSGHTIVCNIMHTKGHGCVVRKLLPYTIVQLACRVEDCSAHRLLLLELPSQVPSRLHSSFFQVPKTSKVDPKISQAQNIKKIKTYCVVQNIKHVSNPRPLGYMSDLFPLCPVRMRSKIPDKLSGNSLSGSERNLFWKPE